jgi:FAS-associated factor 2
MAARERERDRMLREEQDRAFKDSARKDRERIQTKIEEEQRAVEEKERLAEEVRLEEEKLVAERDDLARKEATRMDWRRWARKALVLPEPVGEKSGIRIAIRLPGGDGRSIRRFSSEATLTTLYAYVDSHFIPTHYVPTDDPDAPPHAIAAGETGIQHQIQLLGDNADDWWGFKLVLAYPRRELHWRAGTSLASVEGLKGGAQIVVEKTTSPRAASPTEEDDYDTESD